MPWNMEGDEKKLVILGDDGIVEVYRQNKRRVEYLDEDIKDIKGMSWNMKGNEKKPMIFGGNGIAEAYGRNKRKVNYLDEDIKDIKEIKVRNAHGPTQSQLRVYPNKPCKVEPVNKPYAAAMHPPSRNLDTRIRRNAFPQDKTRQNSRKGKAPRLFNGILFPPGVPVMEVLSNFLTCSCRDPSCTCRPKSSGSHSIDEPSGGPKLIDFLGLSRSSELGCPCWKKCQKKKGSPESFLTQEVSEPFQDLSADARNLRGKKNTEILNLELTLYCGEKPCK